MSAKDNTNVFPVYILSRVVQGIKNHCRNEVPKEALGVLIGYKRQYKGKHFTKIIDWATGRVDSSSVFAKFTREGVIDYRLFIKERYGNKNAPKVVGIYHSHPFGHTPEFSAIDFDLFFTPVYTSVGNVFILVDPIIDAFRVFAFSKNNNEKKISFTEVDWCEYEPYYNPKKSINRITEKRDVSEEYKDDE